MRFFESFQLALKNILGSKVRTFLTMLGIIIGVTAVIVIVGLGNGMENYMTEQFSEMGTNTLTVNIRGRGSSRSVSVDQMYALVEDNPEYLDQLSPMVTMSATVKIGTETPDSTSVTGVSEAYFGMKGYTVDQGRGLEYVDVSARKHVCIIGNYLNQTYYSGNAVGQTLKINGNEMTIVGVMAQQTDDMEEGGTDDCVYLPYTTAARMSFMGIINSYTITVKDENQAAACKTLVENALYKIFEDEDAYTVTSMAELLDTMTSMINVVITILAAIAAISLVVGGIGIMNIMLVSVTERTREIGIRKALGAKERYIMQQFVIEAATTSALGGVLGIGLGYTYAVSRDGFVTRTGSVSVTAADAAGHTEKVLSVSLTSKPSQGGESLRVQVRVEMHPAGGAEGTYTYRHDASAYTALAARSVTLSRGSTVFDALDASGAAYHEKSWGYIDSIGGVEERQYGPNSGWMFLLNGTAGTESCRTARLSDGDQVVWFYTDDYTRDYGSESWSSASGTGSAGTVITVTAASPAVTARQAAQAAAALPASGGSITVSAPGCTAVSLPVKTAGELAAKTGAGWTAVLSGGRVTLPAKALQALAAQASGDELTLFVHKESASVFQVKLTCGGREIKDLGAAALTAELPADGDFSGARNCRVAVRTASGRTSFVIGSVESIGGAAFVCLSLTQSAQVTITGEALGAAPFPDTAGHWAEPSVNAIFARGVLGGVSLTAFGPDRPMTRAMAVTALWRLAGEPAAPADGDFSDLTGAWCAAAARWARAQGVANGYGDGSFRPDAAVARQELAAMLCRYAGAPAAGGKLAFADAGTAAPWALPALTWAVSEGYLTGVTPAELDPRGQVTRAQAAVILERFCEKTA
jgi:putative ABC transport system permease protein